MPVLAPPPVHVVAPASARIGHRLTVSASNLKRGRYTLTVVLDHKPGPNTRCLGDVAGPRRAGGGRVRLSGRVPRTLTCFQGATTRVGLVTTPPGAYHLVIGVKVAGNGWTQRASFVKRAIRLKR